jgi:hypothetical protein
MYELRYANEYSETVQRELKTFFVRMERFLLQGHNDDGTHNFGLQTNGHSGESGGSLPAINLNSQSFINNLDPGFQLMLQTLLSSGTLNDAIAAALQRLVDSGDVVLGETKFVGVPLSEVQIEAMPTTPLQVIPAPASGIQTIVLNMTVATERTAQYTGTATSFRLRYAGQATDILSAASALTAAGVTNYRNGSHTSAFNFLDSTFDPRGKAMELDLNGSLTNPLVGSARGYFIAFYTEVEGNG